MCFIWFTKIFLQIQKAFFDRRTPTCTAISFAENLRNDFIRNSCDIDNVSMHDFNHNLVVRESQDKFAPQKQYLAIHSIH